METGLWRQFDRIVVFDTETTGIEFGQDEIIELGAAAFSPKILKNCCPPGGQNSPPARQSRAIRFHFGGPAGPPNLPKRVS